MKKQQGLLTALTFLTYPLHAAAPTWWSEQSTEIIEPNGIAANYAPANLGQLKNVAAKAKAYLDFHLPGGAGTEIDALVAAFEPRQGQGYTQAQIDAYRAANYAPINLGQLKAVAKPFYDRLRTTGFDTKASLQQHGAAEWGFDYPWPPNTPITENVLPANLGQLKWVFSFSGVSPDTDGDNLPDWWEMLSAANLTSLSGLNGEDNDGDNVSDLKEFIARTSATNPAPVITVETPTSAEINP